VNEATGIGITGGGSGASSRGLFVAAGFAGRAARFGRAPRRAAVFRFFAAGLALAFRFFAAPFPFVDFFCGFMEAIHPPASEPAQVHRCRIDAKMPIPCVLYNGSSLHYTDKTCRPPHAERA
jgi:hypothetical protein